LFEFSIHAQVGAYQEVLGSLHNLYGDTNAVHVDIDPENEKGYTVNHVIKGDTTDEVLRFMQYDGQVRERKRKGEKLMVFD
jgi:arginine decarboxylase